MKKKTICSSILTLVFIFVIYNFQSIDVEAATFSMNGTKYTFYEDNDNDYDTKKPSEIASISDGANAWGRLVIDGDIEKISENKYNVKSDEFNISYNVNQSQYEKSEYDWNIKSDNEDDVDGMELDKDIDNGAIIVKTSYDGINWVLDKTLVDVFKSNSTLGSNFYAGNNIQLYNGTYYQITIVYRQTKRLDDTSILFVDTSSWEDRYVLERYEFYAENTEEKNNEAKHNADEKTQVDNKKIKVEKDSGYRLDKEEDLDRDDPHYGWELGSFFVKGYTAKSEDKDGYKVFMKNVGDRVRLYFNLTQNINKLNNNEDLSIEENDGGYDKYFEINRTNFKRGTLIVQFTDSEGTKHDPVIYTNFLESLTHPGADTKIDLFEEGDYEVALDYKILNKSGIDSTTDYKIYFKFKIRNGNCKAFVMDCADKSELKNKAFTPNGFYIDLAASKYLKCSVDEYSIDVVRDTHDNIRLHSDGNKVANDGNEYKKPGKYILTIKNPSAETDEIIEIYVGGDEDKDKYIKALAKNVNTIDEINKMLAEGGKIQSDGTIVMPTPTPMPTATPLPTVTPMPTTTPMPTLSPIPTVTNKPSETPTSSVTPKVDVPTVTEEPTPTPKHDEPIIINPDPPIWPYILLLVIGIGIGIGAAVIIPRLKKNKNDNKLNDLDKENNKEDKQE